MKHGRIYIGTSGWHYKHWIGTFYPESTKANAQFGLYQQKFNTVEINNSFYKLPSAETFQTWRTASRDDFLFSVKASRYITHMKKLKNPIETTQKFFDNIVLLREKLGPVLFQLPPLWNVNYDRLRSFLAALPGEFRCTFEFRNESWYNDEIFQLLQEYNCAFCVYELAGHQTPLTVTADFVYVRLHGPGAKYQGSYTETQLATWAERCNEWTRRGLDCFFYFDNDQNGYAAFNAQTLNDMMT